VAARKRRLPANANVRSARRMASARAPSSRRRRRSPSCAATEKKAAVRRATPRATPRDLRKFRARGERHRLAAVVGRGKVGDFRRATIKMAPVEAGIDLPGCIARTPSRDHELFIVVPTNSKVGMTVMAIIYHARRP